MNKENFELFEHFDYAKVFESDFLYIDEVSIEELKKCSGPFSDERKNVNIYKNGERFLIEMIVIEIIHIPSFVDFILEDIFRLFNTRRLWADYKRLNDKKVNENYYKKDKLYRNPFNKKDEFYGYKPGYYLSKKERKECLNISQNVVKINYKKSE